MPRLAAACLLWLGAFAGAPTAAQVPAPDPPGPYVVDVRGVTSGFPGDAAFFPPAPSGTIVPSRGFGIDLGGHVYLFRLGASRVGIGANLLRVSHKTSPPAPTGSTGTKTSATTRTIPDVDATLTTVAPQVSFNFGSADGWSYLSVGLGIAEVKAATSGTATRGARDSGRLSSVNFGGGARWFRNTHLAFAFDVRLHLVSAGERPIPLRSTPRTMLVSASGGISLR